MFAKDDLDFIRKRVVGTILKYGKEPVYISAIGPVAGVITFQCQYLRDDTQVVVPMDNIDFRPVSLGFVNFSNKNAVWCARAPIRAWQQGLSNQNISNSDGAVIDVVERRRDLHNTICNIYPPLEVAAKSKLKKAFSKDFAVQDNLIFYKDLGTVGTYKDKTISLYDRFIYLREYLEESVA
jgi:hypothetical protein